MKTFLSLFLIGMFVFSSCNGTNEEENTENDSLTTEEVTTEETTEKTEVEKSVLFEDYANIKTKDALVEKYGADNIKNSVEAFAEGTIEKPVSLLTDPENGNIIKYVWDDDNTLSWIQASETVLDENYEVVGKQSVKTKEGLWLGMPLADLRKWNGANFKFSGFGWDFGGGIYAEKGSKIANSKIMMTLGYSGDLPSSAMGDVELYADDENLKDAKIVVSNFSLYIEENNED